MFFFFADGKVYFDAFFLPSADNGKPFLYRLLDKRLTAKMPPDGKLTVSHSVGEERRERKRRKEKGAAGATPGPPGRLRDQAPLWAARGGRADGVSRAAGGGASGRQRRAA